MNPTQTGIATALALGVVLIFFFLGGFSFFSPAELDTAPEAAAFNPITSPTMPTTPDATQLQATDEVVGTGATAEAGDTITVNYVGALTDGTVFDASAKHGNEGFTFVLGSGAVIPGWDQGIVGMKEGGRRILVIPPALAYGDQAVGNIIPANSTLLFQVELVRVQKAAQ